MGASVLVSALLVVWLGLISWFGATEVFVAPGGAPPLRQLAVVPGPVIAFLIAYRVSPAVRESVLRADLSFLTTTQAWRFGGIAFLALNAYGVLPTYFAWPAGLGDMAIGATTPWMIAGLAREPSHRRHQPLGRCAVAVSRPRQCDPDRRNDASPDEC